MKRILKDSHLVDGYAIFMRNKVFLRTFPIHKEWLTEFIVVNVISQVVWNLTREWFNPLAVTKRVQSI